MWYPRNFQILTVPRSLPLATHRPSGENAATIITVSLSDDLPKGLPVCVCSTFIWFQDVLNMNLPSGEYWIDVEVSVAGGLWISSNVFVSQKTVVPSIEAVANVSLVGWKAIEWIAVEWDLIRTEWFVPVVRSQMMTDPSDDPEAKYCPFGK